MSETIQLRRDTAANWTSANPTLASGEIGIETDTGKFKLGNGSTGWTSLAYWNGGGAYGGAANGFTAPDVITVTDASVVGVNASLGNWFRVTLTSAVGSTRSVAVPTNPVDGQQIMFEFIQPASGGPCTVTWASGTGGYSFEAGEAPVLSSAASTSDIVTFTYSGAAQQWINSDPGNAFVPLSGGTMTGPLLVNTESSPATSARETLDIASSATGQSRVRLESFFETDPTGAAEVARLHFGRATGNGALGGDSSKAALAWFDDTISATQSQVWVQAHNYLHQYDPQTFSPAGVNTSTSVITYTPAGVAPPNAWQVQFSTTGTLPAGLTAETNYYVDVLSSTTFSVYQDSGLTEQVTLTSQGSGTHTMAPQLSYNNNHHQHFSIEVTDSSLSDKSTRFSIPWGFDQAEIGFFGSNVTVEGGILRVCGGSGSTRQFVLGNTLSDNLTPDGTQDRWVLSATSTAESGSNAGSDFAINRYSDTGTELATALFIQRSSGKVSIGGSTSPANQLEIGSASSGSTSAVIFRGLTSNSASLTLDTGGTDYWSVQMRNDSTNDLHIRDVNEGLDAIYVQHRATMLNLGLLGEPSSFNSGVGVVYLANASTAPSGTPSGGGLLYASGGHLYWLGATGTAVEIA